MIDYNRFVTETVEEDAEWRTENPEGKVEFVTKERHYGVIPAPEPAYKHLPEWYKSLSLERHGGSEQKSIKKSTVRACIPFLEAMKLGWVLRAPADISLTVDGGRFEYEWKYPSEEDVMTHFPRNVVGADFPSDSPILKFHSLWRIKTPDGYSTLFMPLANRLEEPRFESFFGLLDSDKMSGNANVIVRWDAGDFDGVIKKGTPLAQVIPIRRDALLGDGKARSMTEDEVTETDKYNAAISGNQRHYRDNLWEPVDATKTDEEP